VATYACNQCGAGLAFDGVRTARCPYCDSPNFVERAPADGQPDPAFVVTFVGDAQVAHRALDRWIGSRSIFADSSLRSAKVEDLKGIYAPAYLYSAVATSDFSAVIGENYTETETYQERDSEGKTVTRTRTVTRTEHRPLSGRHVSYVTDVLVSASAGLPNDELARIEPYDYKQLRRFSPGLVTGWIAEEFKRTRDDCEQLSRAEARQQIGCKLAAFMPGDSHGSLEWTSVTSWESLDPVLVPVWVLAVRYRPESPPLRVVINGQTGAVHGKTPLSAVKITLFVLALLAAIAAVVLLILRSKP
jgi:hypothetical protein